MPPLSSDLRKSLDKAVVAARDEAESACEAALRALGVPADQAPLGISDEQRGLRNALRAKQRQLGGAFEQMIAECAYEQWHLMLFARFLAENELLIHPSGAPVTLEEVAELAREEGESDAWLLAARYAAAMLPGIFKPADPCVRLPLAPEGRKALEDILTALPSEVFTADDALGWVYQFWQTKKKKDVNASERKIGGADLAPVTQLFTEHYMVRFLVENSLGAWWAARHPQSPLLAEWEYLRFTDDGEAAAGRFEGWPKTVAEVTMMDPCCGSGHFPVAAFDMLWKMRKEEEGLSTRDAVDAVLRDNLYGLELDPRCIQLAALALALAAWKLSGYHELPALNLACSGIPTRGSLGEWTKLAEGDERLERALARLHELFKEADTLGSLIDPRRAVEDGTLESVPFEEVAPLLEKALAGDPDPVAAVFNEGAREVAKAAALLAGSYTLVATNPPYLMRTKHGPVLADFCARMHPMGKTDLATSFMNRARSWTAFRSSVCMVVPQNWMFSSRFEGFRRDFLKSVQIRILARLGEHAFGSSAAAGAFVALIAWTVDRADEAHKVRAWDASVQTLPIQKADALRGSSPSVFVQAEQTQHPQARVILGGFEAGPRLGSTCVSRQGIKTTDDAQFVRAFWEAPNIRYPHWEPYQSSVRRVTAFGGREQVILFEGGKGRLRRLAAGEARDRQRDMQGAQVWSRRGVAVSLMRSLPATLYTGEKFASNVAAVVPANEDDLPAVWAYCSSRAFHDAVRQLDQKIAVSNATLLQVPFDLDHWQKVAAEEYPDGLPAPHSDDPTQWLFKGNVVGSEQPLHVALARLLGHRWPDQEPDGLDALADEDGIACLPAVAGELPVHERLRQLLEAAYGGSFSQKTLDELLAPEGSATLEDWLRDKALASHAKLFDNRPFIWHIWDGRRDGFAALVNYHRLDHQTLEKLAFTYLNWWIERQKSDMANDVSGAEARLAAAQELQRKLKLVLEGDKPYDAYVRWKSLAEQALGWAPDLNDGVRLNIRPFVTAEVLRAKLPSIKWGKDGGKQPDGSERLNDLHYTLAEKRVAREEAARCG